MHIRPKWLTEKNYGYDTLKCRTVYGTPKRYARAVRKVEHTAWHTPNNGPIGNSCIILPHSVKIGNQLYPLT